MANILINGTNRGLGLEFVRQYSERGHRVFACCRNRETAQDLKQIASSGENVSIHQLDVDNYDQIDAVAQELQGTNIDLLINNAGVYGDRDAGLGKVNYDTWAKVLRINSIAPLKMTEAFLDHLSRGEQKKLVIISSRMGSIADNTSGASYVYRSSKAAVNAVVKSLSIDLKSRGITVAILHPGWVATDMGGPRALIQPQESIMKMREVIDGLTQEDTGKFLSYDGSVIPW